MKYHINVNKTVNQLVPHYLGGRKLILYLQAVLQPLQSLNDLFDEWAFEKRVEAAMTSQLFKFEWFLNWKFSKYFQNKNERIAVHTTTHLGTVLHWEDSQASGVEHQVIRIEDESASASENMVLYYPDEDDSDNDTSFIVSTPAIDTTKISTEDYLSLLTYQVDKYKIAGKTYSIKFNNETL